jgi:hypothetical protein
MRLNTSLKVIAVFAVVYVPLATAVSWYATRPAPPKPAAASTAVQRLAEAYASAAFRPVVTSDYAALGQLVRQAAAWPEVVYLGIEDRNGRILAHTDPSRVGRTWTDGVGADIRRTVKVPYEEVVAPLVDPNEGGKLPARVGHVRLGYAVPRGPTAGTPASRPDASGWLVLALPALAAIVTALVMTSSVVRRRHEGAAHGPRIDEPAPDEAPAESPAAERLPDAPADAASSDIAAPAPDAEPPSVEDRVEAVKHAARVEGVRLSDEVARLIVDRVGSTPSRFRTAVARVTAFSALTGSPVDAALADEILTDLLDADGTVPPPARAPRTPDRPAPPGDRANGTPGGHADEPGAWRAGPVEAEAAPRPLEARLAELQERHRRALRHVAHLVRGSLTSILGFATLLLRRVDGPLNASQAASVWNIQQAGARLLTFVNTLSEFARIDGGTVEPDPEDVELVGLLREIAAERDFHDAVTFAADSCENAVARVDARHARSILAALLQPAASASAPAPGVLVAARAGRDTIEIEVACRDRHLPAEEVAGLFDPFPDSDGPASLANGAGDRIQLATARALATLNGGTLGAESRARTGLVFTLRLPAAARASRRARRDRETATR